MASTSPRSIDAVIVGSGMNSLVCAALLGRDGRKVLVLERESRLGGCIRTDELTLPGFRHDTLSTAHPLFLVGPAYAALKDDLHRAGLVYCNTDEPTGVLLPDGRHLVLSTSRERNLQRLGADGAAFAAALSEIGAHAPLLFSLLGNELWRLSTAKTLATAAWKQGPHALAGFFGEAMTPARAWLEQAFRSDLPGALLAPWVLHCGLGPDAALSALMAKVVAFTLEAVGMPMVQGGSANIVRAFEALITKVGGRWETSA
ncbi:MAG TPA: NAD(P)/FAD-dependent oxidoreductase, partial [Burkholderiaceae bacterium]|nr:NAD(P)/FAD-dependent oxidoreductase [Burkholderiaceae bacterium]